MHVVFAHRAKPDEDKLTMVCTVGNIRKFATQILEATELLQHEPARIISFDTTGRFNPGVDPQMKKEG